MKVDDFNKNEMSYLNDYIKFADTKAGALVGLDGLMLKFDLNQFATPLTYTPSQLIGILALVILLLAIVLDVLVVFPRTGSKPRRGAIFWDNVVQFKRAAQYQSYVLGLDENELNKIMAEQNFHLAETAHRKYHVLKSAFWASAFGAIIVLLTAILPHITHH
ncbi:Pycsar system effector family protein [Alicyclobacillus mengziensis]|uniref:Pycsar effector protein domain-containing protein n=1 Tax=Alicyclobacillus mengziensis TaxID=2931921 RepID=A0A9X7W1T2_9BACL|nr:Pycsar system effector family protein [Alicyclobacillus mengziensis]QSO49183.1 hypothetical protein JZ786_09820 [Alicyclobacillus mengziensis]